MWGVRDGSRDTGGEAVLAGQAGRGRALNGGDTWLGGTCFAAHGSRPRMRSGGVFRERGRSKTLPGLAHNNPTPMGRPTAFLLNWQEVDGWRTTFRFRQARGSDGAGAQALRGGAQRHHHPCGICVRPTGNLLPEQSEGRCPQGLSGHGPVRGSLLLCVSRVPALRDAPALVAHVPRPPPVGHKMTWKGAVRRTGGAPERKGQGATCHQSSHMA